MHVLTYLAQGTSSATISGTTWAAIAALAGGFTFIITICGVGVKMISKFTSLINSVDSLNDNMKTVVSAVGNHEHRLSLLEGSSARKDTQEKNS